jgi:hypothetical protein
LVLKKVKFRAKLTTIGKGKIHLYVPRRYHEQLKNYKLLGEYVDVEVTEVPKTAADYY